MTRLRRRDLLRALVVGSAIPVVRPSDAAAHLLGPALDLHRAAASRYGRWVTVEDAPAFLYDADHESLPEAEWDPLLEPRTRRHWVMVGNRAIRMQAANDGTVALFDERDALRWITAPDPQGTGLSVVDDGSGPWSTEYARRAGSRPSHRIFGPTWFSVRDARAGLSLTRTLLCPEGELPWLLVRVRLTLARGERRRSLRHVERWALRPRFVNLLENAAQRRARAEQGVAYSLQQSERGWRAEEVFTHDPALVPYLLGPPAQVILERLGETDGVALLGADGAVHPTLEIESEISLRPGESRELWFRFGHADAAPADPARLFDASRRQLARRLPRAFALRAPEATREVPWHAALLTGALAVDRVIGGHTLDQGSAYSYTVGFNGAARDTLQHALPLVYIDPAHALSVLRNTCAWATPEGDLPYALDAAKRPTSLLFRPSDQNLWALWLACEYAAATGDRAAFDAPLAYHPVRNAEPVPLREHLRRQLRFFVDVVGRGAGGHVRILNADWNDVAIRDSGVDAASMIAGGSSVLNSAMAAWVLATYAGLAQRLGDAALAREARAQADELRALVANAWNGRWFHRAYAPDLRPVGDTDCWLEVQPWAILCGAADPAQARSLLETVDRGHRAGSPLGARVRWPADPERLATGEWGSALLGGIWYSISMTLVWAAAHVDRRLAWSEWRRMSLAAHTSAYPEIWEGTLSGPDAWNAPESPRPGRTWAALPLLAMQTFPVHNGHSHSQPLLAYLRLLGVEPTERGSLAVGKGGWFRSESFRLDGAGHGRLAVRGQTTLETAHGCVTGGPGELRW